jgi:hypothetical protein
VLTAIADGEAVVTAVLGQPGCDWQGVHGIAPAGNVPERSALPPSRNSASNSLCLTSPLLIIDAFTVPGGPVINRSPLQ